MKKWFSLIVMTSILFGAVYLAVATESGRNMLMRTEQTRALLQEVEYMIAKYGADESLLNKRAELMQEMANVEPVAAISEVVAAPANDDYERAMQAEIEAEQAYNEALLERYHSGVQLSEGEKHELESRGLLDESRPEEGRNPLDAQGGPDGFGYRWVDNLDTDTATFAWEDIVGAPGATLLSTISNHDDAAVAVNLSFSFPFYGVMRTTVYPSSNGAIGMGSGTGFSNTCTLPTSGTGFTQGAIFAFWDDQHTGRGGTGVGGTVSDSGSVWVKDEGNRVIIQWDSVGRLSPTYQHTYTYQAILHSDGKIKLQYLAIDRYAPSTRFPSATIAIQQGSTAPDNNFIVYDCDASAVPGGVERQDTIRNRAVWFYQLSFENDFACASVLQPSPLRVGPGVPFNVVGRFRNVGSVMQSSPISYSFNGGPVVTEATASLPQFGSEDHDFAGTETAPPVGDYELVMWSELPADEDTENDTVRVTVLVRDCYDFSVADNFVATGTTCGFGNDITGLTCMGTGDDSEDVIYQWTVTQAGNYTVRYNVPTSATLGMSINTACPPDNNNWLRCSSLFQDTLSYECVPITSAGTYYIMIDRSSSCNTYTLTASQCVDNDFGCTAVTAPSGTRRVEIGASFNVIATYRNNGLVTQASPVSYSFNGGPVVTENTASLGPNATENHDFAGTETAPSTPGVYELLCYSSLPTDQNNLNDTLRVNITVYQGRCCYAESCVDTTAARCTELGGLFDTSATCANDPCPTILNGSDLCADAVELTVPSSVVGSLAGSTPETGVPTSCGGYSYALTSNGRWYTVTGTGNTMTASLCYSGTNYDSKLFVYFGACDNFICIDGSDDECADPSLASFVTWCTAPGTDYLILVTSFSTTGNNGNYELNISDDGVACGGAIDCNPAGRCCYVANDAVNCVDNLLAECNALGGVWTDAATCADGCPPIGRCCYGGVGFCGSDQTCEDSLFQAQCTALGGTWTEGTDCSVECPSLFCTCDCIGQPNVYSTLAADAGTYPIEDLITTNVTINVPVGSTITDINVRLDIIHTFDGDLVIRLISPLGTIDTLSNRRGSLNENYLCTVFDDEAATPIGSGTAPFTGSFIPEQPLSVFDGENSQGDWILSVSDLANIDEGYIAGVCLEFEAPPAPCDPVVDLAISVISVANVAEHVQLHFTAPQDEDYRIYSTLNPHNDGNPDGGTDPDFSLEVFLPGLLAGPQVWDAPVGFVGANPGPNAPKFYVVVSDCVPTP